MTDHTKEIADLLTKYKSILVDDLLSNKSVLQTLVDETIIDKKDLEFLLQADETSESENELNDKKCQYLIEIISKDGLKAFKKFCYTIETDCKTLITALINDSLNCGKYELTQLPDDFVNQTSFIDDGYSGVTSHKFGGDEGCETSELSQTLFVQRHHKYYPMHHHRKYLL